MNGRRLVLFLFLYLALDFANPMMPGAVAFAVEECTEGVRGERLRRDALPPMPGALPPREPPTARPVPLTVRRAPLPDVPRGGRLPHRRSHARAADAAPSADDH